MATYTTIIPMDPASTQAMTKPYRPRPGPQLAPPDAQQQQDWATLQAADARIKWAPLAELQALVPDVQAAHRRSMARLSDADRHHAVACAAGAAADRYAAGMAVVEMERSELAAHTLAERLRTAIITHERRAATTARRETFAREAGATVAEAQQPSGTAS